MRYEVRGTRGRQEAKTTIWILNWTAFCATYARELAQPPVEWSADRRTWADLLPTCRGWSCCFFGFNFGAGTAAEAEAETEAEPPSIAPNYLLIVILHVWPRPGRAKSKSEPKELAKTEPETATWLPAVASTQFQLPISNLWLGSLVSVAAHLKEKSDTT